MRLEGKQSLVVGLGESGKAAARFLAARGARVLVNDCRSERELSSEVAELRSLGVEFCLGSHPESLFVAQDLIIPSPGVPWDLPALQAARRQGVAVMGELEVAAGLLQGPVVGVTGTNGKTTTTALIGHIFQSAGWQARTGGNLGTPLLALVESSHHSIWNVLELSSFQLEATRSFPVHIGVVLNITPDHLDRHGTFEAYAAAKARILQAQSASDHIVLNADDPVCRTFAEQARSRVCWFSRTAPVSPGASVEGGWITFDRARVVDTELPIRGPHNLENALAAVAVTRLAGIPREAVAAGVKTFRPVEHRLEFVRTVGGVDYYNDSKATNVDAARKAIESFERSLWVILGGSEKGADFSPLRSPLRSRARGVLLIGDSAEKIERHLEGCVASQRVQTLQKAVEEAHRQARPGDTVLLAPACASFDQFENYGHRGRVFKDLARLLN